MSLFFNKKIRNTKKKTMINIDNVLIQDIELYITKYSDVLDSLEDKSHTPYFAYILHIAFNHIKENHNDLDKDWKARSIVVLKELFENISVEEDIIVFVDSFIKYYNIEFDKYMTNIIPTGSPEHFIHLYIKNVKDGRIY